MREAMQFPESISIETSLSVTHFARAVPQADRREVRSQASKSWLLRAAILSLVFALHIGVGVLFLAPPVVKPGSPMQIVSPVLEVRFIKSLPKLAVVRKQPASLPEVETSIKRRIRSTAKRAPAADSSPAELTTQMISSPQALTPKAYVPGGKLLEAIAVPQSNIRLPGAGDIKGAPRFRMVDPKSQGLAGVVRFIGGLAGAVDPHCLDLDAWQAMTTEERIENHVSPDEMEKIGQNYGCKAPRGRRPL